MLIRNFRLPKGLLKFSFEHATNKEQKSNYPNYKQLPVCFSKKSENFLPACLDQEIKCSAISISASF